MADLLTHAALALLLKRTQLGLQPSRPLHLASFTAGNLLPDLLARLPAEAFTRLQALGAPVPPLLLHGWGVAHVPAGMVLLAFAAALGFARPQRAAIFGNLLAGMLLHLAIDLVQSHAGAGYLLLFPFSKRPFELGWLGTEATVFLAPALVALAVGAWWRASRLPSPASSPAPPLEP